RITNYRQQSKIRKFVNIPIGKSSKRFSDLNVVVSDKELRRALCRPADHSNQPRDLFSCNQAESAAVGAREHSPVRIFLFADVSGIFEHENRARLHLLRYPFAQDFEFSNHFPSSRANSLLRTQSRLANRMNFFGSTAARALAPADHSLNLANSVAQANGKHRLP